MARVAILSAAKDWVAVANFGHENAHLDGWRLGDYRLRGVTLPPGAVGRVDDVAGAHMGVALLDARGRAVDAAPHTDAAHDGPVVYALDPRMAVEEHDYHEIPHAGVGILCALANTVTVANLSDKNVALDGWSLGGYELEGVLRPGEAERFEVEPVDTERGMFHELIDHRDELVDTVLFPPVEDNRLLVFDLDHRIAARQLLADAEAMEQREAGVVVVDDLDVGDAYGDLAQRTLEKDAFDSAVGVDKVVEDHVLQPETVEEDAPVEVQKDDAQEKSAVDQELASSVSVEAIKSKWNRGITGEAERSVPEHNAAEVGATGTVDAMTAKWNEATQDDTPKTAEVEDGLAAGSVNAMTSKWAAGDTENVAAERGLVSKESVDTKTDVEDVPKGSVSAITSKWDDIVAEKEAERSEPSGENLEQGAVTALTSKWANGQSEEVEAPKSESREPGLATVPEEEEEEEVSKGALAALTSMWAVDEVAEKSESAVAKEEAVGTATDKTAAVDDVDSAREVADAEAEPVQVGNVVESRGLNDVELLQGDAETLAVPAAVIAKTTPTREEAQQAKVAEDVEPKSSEEVGVGQGLATLVPDADKADDVEPEASEEDASNDVAGGAVNAMTAKWNSATEEADVLKTMKVDEQVTSGSVSALASKWSSAKWDEKKEDDTAVSENTAAKEVSTSSVSALASRWATVGAEDGQKQKSVPAEDADQLKTGAVSAVTSKWGSKDETVKSRSVEKVPRSNSAVSALTSMWAGKSTIPEKEKPTESNIETPEGFVKNVSAKWTENVADEKEVTRTDSSKEVSRGAVTAMTSKWADAVAEEKATRSEPAAENVEQGSVSALKSKWANGQNGIDEVKSDSKPSLAPVPENEEELVLTGSVAALTSKWGAKEASEKEAPGSTVTLEKGSDVSTMKSQLWDETTKKNVEVDTVEDELKGEGFIDVTEKPIEYEESPDVDVIANGSFADISKTKEDPKPSPTSKPPRTKFNRLGVESVIGTGDYVAEYGAVVQDETEEEEEDEEVEILERNTTQPEEDEEEVTVVERNELRDSFLDEKVTVIDRNEMRESFLNEKPTVVERDEQGDSFLDEKVTVIERNEMRDSFLDEKVTVVERNEMRDSFLDKEEEKEETLIVPVESTVVTELDDSKSRIAVGDPSWMAAESAVELDPNSRVDVNTRNRAEVGDLEIVEAIEVEEEVAIDEDYVRRESSGDLRRSLELLPKDRGSKKIDARNKLQFLQRRTGKTKNSFNAPMVLDATDSMKVAEGKPSFVAPPTVDIGVVTPRGSTNEIGRTAAVATTAITEHFAMSHEAFTASGVGVVCAMVNAPGEEKENEWVAVANYSSAPVNLDGWALSDTKRPQLRIGGRLRPGESLRIGNMRNDVTGGAVELPNRQGSIMLFAPDGGVADSVSYIRTRARGIKEGIPFVFHYGEPLGVPDAAHSRDLNAGVGIIAACFAKAGGWVSIANFSRDKLNLAGWSLQVATKKPLLLEGELDLGETLRKERAANSSIETQGDIILRGPTGEVVDKVSFGRGRSVPIVEGTPVIFHANI